MYDAVRNRLAALMSAMLIVQLLVFAVPAYAYETDAGVAAVTDDAVIDSSKPNVNIDSSTNGTTSGLFSVSASNNTKKYAYYKFDLSAVSNPEYKFYLNIGAKMGTSNTNVEVSVLGLDNASWSEKTITWNTAPLTDWTQAVPVGKFKVVAPNGSAPGLYTIDVTDYVRSRVGSGFVTFMIGDTAATGVSFNLYSKEATGSNPEPSLVAKRVVDPTQDTQPPVWPAVGKLSAANIGTDFITLTWPQAADENGVANYRLYKNGELLAQLESAAAYNVTGLTADTAYEFKVEAGDAAGNYSSGLTLAGKTLAAPIQPLQAVGVTASGSDGNVETGTIDNNLYTRWSASGDGSWIMFDLDDTMHIGYLGIAFYKGDVRSTSFEIQTSADAVNWVTAFSGTNPVRTTAMTAFDIPDTDARYVRLVGHGNSDGSSFFSLTEVHVYPPFASGDTPVAVIPYYVPGPPPGTVPFTAPGMTNPDGSPHPVHTPHPVTGQTLNVLQFGADPGDNNNDDTQALQAAINAARPGDEVFLPNGTYNLNYSPDGLINVSLKTGVNVRGESRDGTIVKTSLNKTKNSTTFKSAAQHDLKLSDMTFTSTWNGTYPTDTKANNPQAGGPDSHIILANYGEAPSYNITVDNVAVEKYTRMGIRADNSHDIVIRGSVFRNATDVGPGGSGYGISFQGMPKIDRLGFDNDTKWNLAENNTFEGPYIRHGALIQNVAHNNVIRNNTFRGTKLDAIDLHGELEYLNEIYGNEIADILTGGGVGLGNTGGTAPSNHSASGPKNYIHDNRIVNSREGINVSMGTPDTVIERNIIENSTTVVNGAGINILNGPRTIVRNNIIRNNTAANYWGILLEHDPGDKNAGNIGEGDPLDVLIEGNSIVGNANGIQIAAGTGIILRSNTVTSTGINYAKSDAAQIAEGWPSANADLSSLEITDSSGSVLTGLSPAFSADTTSYKLVVKGNPAPVMVKAAAAATHARMRINGAETASGMPYGPITLATGDNSIRIDVTAETGATKTYDVVVTVDVPPTATVTYSTYGPTNQNVIAAMTPSEPVTVLNNGGSASYTFTGNGSFTFEFVDAGGNLGTATASVSWIDKEAPKLKVTADKPDLGQPNHKLVPIQVTLQADGTGSRIASLKLASIASNEPDNGQGDGDTAGDIQDANFGQNDTSFLLRAERSGKGSGRVYTITYTAADEAGNEANASVQVTVSK
ncbi:DUF7594 domain-containing protein [Paenibacillus hamazuiensis]|uniref:CBM96 family carbohydrate-binding protein n=1 Tax=Paenibacillus hamazuiensis TaxID=2936508 RepID=UPI00200DE761|nr:DNRLRE domain-containing protein [Paenibacillus hamazuiensis]